MPKARSQKEMPFEKALQRLQEIVEILETGEASLEKSLALFEEGVALSRRCNQRLDTAERRLEILIKQAGGKEVVEPFPEEEFFPPPDQEGEEDP